MQCNLDTLGCVQRLPTDVSTLGYMMAFDAVRKDATPQEWRLKPLGTFPFWGS